MLYSLTLLCTLTIGGGPAVESFCHQIVPHATGAKWTRSADQTRAIVLIHGFYIHITNKSVPKAALRPWQHADSALVKELGKSADVFVFAYGQNAPVDVIVKDSQLRDNIAQLRKLGYKEIVLVGHSAGGLIARHFVEDHPDAGVTKVVQVCAPNAGSPLATLHGLKSQKPFLQCLTEDGRKECLKERAAKMIPSKIDFVCVVARTDNKADTDGVVPCQSQWTADLQKQGIPAVAMICGHRDAVRDSKMAKSLAGVICEPHPRWTAERVEIAKKEIFAK
jgi:hypothetical protein